MPICVCALLCVLALSFKMALLLHRSKLLLFNSFWYTPRADFARKVITPKVYKIVNENVNVQQADLSLDQLSSSEIRKNYDDGFMFVQNRNHEEKSRQEKTNNLPQYFKNDDKTNEFRKMMINFSIKKRRDKENLIILEGKRLINDAISLKVNIKCIYFSSEDNLKDIDKLHLLVEQGTQLVKVMYKDIKLFSSLTTSPGLMAIAVKPDLKEVLLESNSMTQMPVSLICDNIRDPGNLGTILRSAVSAGVSQVILTVGCVDLWNTKVIKSSAGAHFRMNVHTGIRWNQLKDYLPQHFALYLADSTTEKSNLGTPGLTNYYDVTFFARDSPNHKVLVIGNEAFGLSRNSYELLANQLSANRVQIPLHNNMESLNSAVASSILLFEMRKQFENFNK